MSGPPREPPPAAEPQPPRSDLIIVEAGQSRERRCADCGRRTAEWKPVRRQGASIILCPDCAAKPVRSDDGGSACPSCGADLGPADQFCGRCGVRIEYACPTCSADVEAEDAFCVKCGTRLA
ncbi:MAG TPA: zinc ribbon domain-containing protein [Thermoplasmata archaeon]